MSEIEPYLPATVARPARHILTEIAMTLACHVVTATTDTSRGLQ